MLTVVDAAPSCSGLVCVDVVDAAPSCSGLVCVDCG